MPNLLTANEVVKLTAADSGFPTDILQINIINFEKLIFKKGCIGMDIYGALLNDLEPVNHAEWQNGTIYATDSKVVYRGNFYRAKNSTTSSPETTNWERLPKFKTDANNKLWEAGLGAWLALNILYRSTKYNLYKNTGKGLMKASEETGTTSVDYKEYIEYKNGLLTDIDDLYISLMDYIKPNTKADDARPKARRRWSV